MLAISHMPRGPFRVGSFDVDPERKVLSDRRSSGTASDEIHLPDKAVGVLVWLALHAGRVCERGEILDEVWGVDREAYDRVLDNAIRDVRRALGDSARDPRYVETIPKRGYRLIAEVSWPAPDPPTTGRLPPDDAPTRLEIVPDVPEPEHRNEDRQLARRVRRSQILLAVLFLALVGAGYRLLTAPFRALTVAVGDIELSPTDLTVRPEQELTDRLAATAVCSGAEFYRFRRLGFLASLQVDGALQRHGDRLTFQVRLEDLPSGDPGRIETVRGPASSGLDPIFDEAAERIHDRIDREICSDLGERPDPRQACHCHQAGERLRGERRYEQAVTYLNRARKADPDLLGPIDAMANIHHIQGRDDLARALLEEGVARATRPVERLLFERRLAQVEGDYDRQEALLQELREYEPEEPQWILATGWFQQTHRRNCRRGLELYRDAIAAEGSSAYFYSYLGSAQLECGEPGEALESFRKYVELEPLSPDAHDALALALWRTGDREAALEALRDALDLDSNYAPSMLQRGHIYRSLGSFEEARRSYEIYRDSDWPNARSDGEIGLARVELRLGNLQEAWQHAQEALRARSDAVEALWIQGMVEAERGRWQEVDDLARQIDGLRRARSTLWQMEYYHHLEGRRLLAQDDPEKAIGAFHRALELHPGDRAYFLMAWGEAFETVDSPGRAAEKYRQVLAWDPNHPDALCALGEQLAERGEDAEARALLRQMDQVLDAAAEDPTAVACRELLRTLERAP